MQPSVIIFGMIAVLFSMLFIVLVAGPLGAALKFIFRSAIGAGLIYILDIILNIMIIILLKVVNMMF